MKTWIQKSVEDVETISFKQTTGKLLLPLQTQINFPLG